MIRKTFNWLLILIALAACEKSNPVLYMIGDSTMANKADLTYPERGWGQLLPVFFDSSLVIDNHAMNGRSTRSFIYESRWDTVMSQLKEGDYIVIQFGHNDAGESKIGRHAVPEEYRYNLTKFVRDARSKGAHPILCTPIVRRNFKEGQLVDLHGVYPGIVREVAKQLKVPLIDMHANSYQLVADLGEEGSLPLFLQIPPGLYEKFPEGKIDNTHFSEKGAMAMAGLFVEGLQEQQIELVKHLHP
ncbi:MAG: rhamnogalacturonan acetylesterase [Prolixibacteraceae bacterium]|nr:rhamnogalacturonan acetylesterase [Prolixibacteraceae bacterium]